MNFIKNAVKLLALVMGSINERLVKQYSPEDDYKRNYCKYSKKYKLCRHLRNKVWCKNKELYSLIKLYKIVKKIRISFVWISLFSYLA